ncbi:hypothetical protein NX722_00590 [Endozoicomonas gorgoniicola]|uniref:Uncharacterized protein n=1 Tax=Endozoicomonas gorgoniicola TaxID=1234144 RepID=A0ABT3MP85_9GAMM|nr:hypothetical protein [Endozoicomonas gorgoniicola]MCW7551179.1 hypothetical protein [Endozoicomonas gorgoniicola]
MLTLDPPPLPDESLYSLVCRAYLVDAGFTHRRALKHIFDPMLQASDLEMIGSQYFPKPQIYLQNDCFQSIFCMKNHHIISLISIFHSRGNNGVTVTPLK